MSKPCFMAFFAIFLYFLWFKYASSIFLWLMVASVYRIRFIILMFSLSIYCACFLLNMMLREPIGDMLGDITLLCTMLLFLMYFLPSCMSKSFSARCLLAFKISLLRSALWNCLAKFLFFAS